MKILIKQINYIALLILIISLVLMLSIAYFYLFKPIFMPRSDLYLLETEQMQIKKELFKKVISLLEQRPNNAKKALEKIHPNPFKF